MKKRSGKKEGCKRKTSNETYQAGELRGKSIGQRHCAVRTVLEFLVLLLLLFTTKRTNQAEGCYQNFRLRDKLNYYGSLNVRRHTARKKEDGQKKKKN